ncbi:MAG: glycosyltransferase [Pirellulales bacterium]|nr:glycosyltransferase [Pirellulales bacterium]
MIGTDNEPRVRSWASKINFPQGDASLEESSGRDREDALDDAEALRAQIASLEEHVQWLQGQLSAITRSRAWRFALRLRGIRERALPPGGRLEGVLRFVYRTAKKSLRPGRKRSIVSPVASETLERKGFVSVVLPVYNHAYLLRNSIESVLAQTYRRFELILVDDGSTDAFAEVAAAYADHPQVRILQQANQKLPKALSNGFQFARGEYWTWTSADNLMHPEQLQRLVAYLEKHRDAAMVYADYLAIDKEGQPLKDPGFRPHNRRRPDDPEIHLPRDAGPLCSVLDNFIGPCFLYRGSAGRLLGEYDPLLGIEDYDYWMRMNSVFRIDHLGRDDVLYQYRVHDDSLSSRAVELKIFERAQNLMVYQRQRERYYRQPWTICAAGAVLSRLKKVKTAPHRVIPWSGEEAARPPGEKTLLMIEARNLPAVAASGLPDDLCVAALFDDDPSAAYRYRSEIRRSGTVCFTQSRNTLERLALLTPRAFLVPSTKSLLESATHYANNRDFYAATRSPAERSRSAPRVFQRPDRPRHVLMQVDSFTQGGMENVVLDLAANLDRRSFRTSLLVLGQRGNAAHEARRRGIRLLALPEDNRENAYRNLLEEEKVDLVHAHFSLFGAPTARSLGVPFVQTIHNTYFWLTPEQRDAHQANDRFTSAYACVSPAAAHYSDVALGLSVSKMLVIHNGINTARLNRTINAQQRDLLRQQWGLGPEHYVFLNVAAIQATKAQCFLVRAFAEVFAEHPQARLILLGKNEDEKYYSRLIQGIRRHGLEPAVLLAGHHENVRPFFDLADAFVLPSFWEGWSLALAEAIYSNLAVVATGVGSAPDLLPKVGGRLVPPPFDMFTNPSLEKLGRHLTADNPRFVGNLAEAMRATCAQCPRPALSDAMRKSLDCRTAYRHYEQLFLWLLQGGDPSAAREWSEPFAEGWESAPLPCRDAA